MASAPPSRRLSVVALVAAPDRVGAREGAAHRRSEVPGGEGAPRVVLPPRESPVDPPGVDTADPRPRVARSHPRLGGGAPPPRFGGIPRGARGPGPGGRPPPRGRARDPSPRGGPPGWGARGSAFWEASPTPGPTGGL